MSMKWSVFVVCAALLASVARAQDPGMRLGFTSICWYFKYNSSAHPDAVEPRHSAGQLTGSYNVSAPDTPRQICSAIAAYLEWPLNDHSGERRDQLLYGFSAVEYF